MVSQLQNRIRLLLVCLCALIVCTVQAQLGEKPYQQWTANEAKALLTNSPWARTETGTISVALDPAITVSRGEPPISAASVNPPTAERAVIVSLRSALPLRQALARLNQLQNKYDRKSESDKARIDEKNKTFLECSECPDYYVVALSPGAVPGSVPGPGLENVVGLPTGLRTMSLGRAKLYVKIKNEKGESRELAKFVNPKFATDDALFYFPRHDSKGEPLITPANRTLTISFDPRILEWRRATITNFDFDVAKIIINGQVAF